MQSTTPGNWFTAWLAALQWPFICGMAFALGRYVKGIEVRVAKSEKQLGDLITRHMPHIHNALAEIKGMLIGAKQ